MARECAQGSVSTPSVPSPQSNHSPPPDSSPPSSLPDLSPSTESTPPIVFPSVPVSVPVMFPAPTADVVMSSAPRVPHVPQSLDPVEVKTLTRLMSTKVKSGPDVSTLTKLAKSLVKSERLIVSEIKLVVLLRVF